MSTAKTGLVYIFILRFIMMKHQQTDQNIRFGCRVASGSATK